MGRAGSSEDWVCSGCSTITDGDPGSCAECGSREVAPVLDGFQIEHGLPVSWDGFEESTSMPSRRRSA